MKTNTLKALVRLTATVAAAILLICGNAVAQTYTTMPAVPSPSGNSIPFGGFGGLTAGYGIQYLITPGTALGGFTTTPSPGNNITTLYIRSVAASSAITYSNFTIKLGQTAATELTTGVWVTSG